MFRLRLLICALVVLLGLTALVAWRVHWGGGGDRVAPERPGPPVEVEKPAEPAPARELEIAGLVRAGDQVPLQALELQLGEERTAVDAGGSFAFPRARRPRLLPLRVLRNAELVASWTVIAGDDNGEPAPPATDGVLVEDELSRAFASKAPARLRFTVNLEAPAVEAGTSDRLFLRVALVEDWGQGARISLGGDARLPDGAHLSASLYFDDERMVAALEPRVKDSRFDAALYWPQGTAFFSGELEARLSYSPVHESFSVLEEWSRAHPDVDWENLQVREARHRVFVGSVEEARAEDRAVSAYYSRQIDEARRLDQALKSTLIRSVDRRGVFLSARRPGGKRAKEPATWLRAELLTGEGKLDEAKWRQFLDEHWRPAVRKLQAEHAERSSEKYGRASSMLSALLDALLEESYGFSKFVIYPAFGLSPHANDDYVDEERSGDLVRLEKIILSSLQGLERYRSLGS